MSAQALAKHVAPLEGPTVSSISDGYKRSEVGVIPRDWNVRRLGDIADPVRGGSPRPAGDPRYFNGHFIPWLTVAALTNIPSAQLVVTETSSMLTEEGSFRSRTLGPGTLIIANSGATLGVAKILGIKCCANDGIAALLRLDKDISSAYLAHYINTRTDYLRDVVATGNGQPNLNTELIANFKVPLPPTLEEQEAIAEALGDADALIESLEQLLAKKRDLKQAAMQQLLTGKNRLPGFEGEWATKRLGDFGVFLKGTGVKKDDALSGPLPCVRYGEIYTTHNDCIRRFTSFISRDVAGTSTRLHRGDLLFAGSGETRDEIGKCVAFIHDEEAYAGGDIVILRTNADDAMFFGYYLNCEPIRVQKASKGQGDAVVHIGANALSSLECYVPERGERLAIAAVLSDLDDELAAIDAKVEKARQIKTGMTQELLTGKTRLV